jgi:hypothetical protein
LVTLNDPVYVEAAQALARRIVREGGSTMADRVEFSLRLCLAREPRPEQMQELAALYADELARYRGDPEAARKLIGIATADMDPVELAAWTVVANVLLNLDGVLTKG